MPNSDISRDGTDFRKHYDRVHMQQGRVLTDDDFNEAQRLEAEDVRRGRAAVIGPAGSPDNGFKLKVVGGQLTLSAGSMYVGGLRLELENDEPFNLQKDWLQQGAGPGQTLTAPAGEQYDLVWLEVWQQPVGAVEDKELLEAALGGADTSTRLRTMRRAQVLSNVGEVDCGDAWQQLLTSLSSQGTLSDDYELKPNAALKVEPDGTTATDDLCSPPIAGGYLGAENQAIRVQLVGNNQFTWGFDNGAPLYRVKLLPDNTGALRRLQMLTLPKDQAHYPLEGQVVELLPWSALLANGQKNAELSGFLAKVSGGYNPDTQELFISAAPPADAGLPSKPFGERWQERSDKNTIKNEAPPEEVYFYLRVWNRGADTTSPAAIGFTPNVGVSLATTGLKVTFSGTQLRKHDYWIIAVRPETPNTVVPWELSDGRAPHGLRRWLAPLGLIHWPGGGAAVQVHTDCRPTFLPLTRMKGCCTYTVGDGTHSYGNFSKIQKAVDSLPPSGGLICVLPGVYDESVHIEEKVAVTIRGCGPRTRVRAVAAPHASPRPAFRILRSSGITLEDMAIESGPRSAVDIFNARQVSVLRCLIQMRDEPTIWQAIFSLGDDILIDSNVIEVLPREGGPPKPTIPPNWNEPGAPAGVNTPPEQITVGYATRGGIQLGGGSDRVSINRNIIRGGIWNGITLGSLRAIETGGHDPVHTPDVPSSEDPCDPCRPPDLTDEDETADPNVRYRSWGDLYDITISGNRISDMGINGIGVVRFFNLAGGGDLIGVHGLHITDNYITRCMRRTSAQVSQAMQFLIGYGGIALALVRDLRILRNEIVRNGTSHLQPICGVFAIFVQGLQLDDNRILDNGPRNSEPVEKAQSGLRGGVHIWMVTTPMETKLPQLGLKANSSAVLKKNLPACTMRDNLIAAPLGRSLTFFALGGVVVNRNRLLTEATTGRDFDLLAATVLIGNLGISNELTLGLLTVFSQILFGKLVIGDWCDTAKNFGLINPFPPVSLWPPLVSRWAAGKTLISENQITLDVTSEPLGFGISSVLIATLDDLGMADNQCEITTTNVFFFVNALLAGASVRVTDNRWAETWMHAKYSGWSVGGMNTTTDNQSTHCLLAQSFLNLLVFRHNLALVTGFCPLECGRNTEIDQ